MFKKKFVILAIFLVSLMAVSAVSAADNATGDVVGVEGIADEAVGVEENQIYLEENDVGTFTDLANEIANATGELNLTRDYAYGDDEPDYEYGLIIDKSIVINGNGYTINGNYEAEIFSIADSNVVVLKNINFVNSANDIYWCADNGVVSGCTFVNSRGSVLWYGANGTLSDCSFVDCHADENGGSVLWYGADGTLSDCSFVDCHADEEGGAICWYGADGTLRNCSFVNCSVKGEFNEYIYGGAIYWTGNNGSLSNCSFINCKGSHHEEEGFYDEDYYFIDEYGIESKGGAVYWSGADGTLSDSSFIDCFASYGGAVYWYGKDGSLSNSSFIKCVSADDSTVGGAVYRYGNNLSLSNCSFIVPTEIYASNVSTIYGDSKNLTATLRDFRDDILVGEQISILLNGVEYSLKTNSEGQVSLAIPTDLVPDTYTATISYAGKDIYTSSNTTASVIVDKASPVITIYNAGYYVVATLKDDYGNVINGVEVELVAGSLSKIARTDENGQVSLDISGLDPSEYVASAISEVTDYYYGANVTVPIVYGIGTFTELADEISDAEGELNLTRNYYYVADGDSNYENGIIIDKSIVINGNGFTINGRNQANTIFRIAYPNEVVLNDINFVNSFADGQTICWDGDNGVLSNCSFVNCSANSGGAVYWSGADGVLSACSFVNCSARYYGGAVYWSGADGTLRNCSFIMCVSAYEEGGAVYWSGADGTLRNCSFVNCSADNFEDKNAVGGAVYWSGADGTLRDCSFVDCSSEYWAGAIAIDGHGDCIIYNCSFVNCSAIYGGAVYWGSHNGVLANCSFVDCSASYAGGAVYWKHMDGVLANCSFVDCSAIYGGAVDWYDANGVLANCSFVDCSASEGGAVCWADANGVLANCSFVNCSAKGGAIVWYGHNGVLSACSFVNCSARYYGGAVYWSGDNGSIVKSSFVNCSAESGGGIYFNGKNCTLIDSTFKGNVAKNGPNWYVRNGYTINPVLTVSDMVVDYNSSSRLYVSLKDGEGNPISGVKVKVVLGNIAKNIKTDVKGRISVSTKTLNPGNYTAFISSEGKDVYAPLNATANVFVKAETILSAKDVVTFYNANSRLYVSLKDGEGNPISGVKVKVVLGSITKNIKTDAKGRISVSTKPLGIGNYTALISCEGNDVYSKSNAAANVIVNGLPVVLSADDVVAEYNVSSRLYATLKDADGNPIVGAKVNLVLGTINKTVKTDAKGRISASTKSLAIGNYTAFISFAGTEIYAPSNCTANVIVNGLSVVLSAADVVAEYNVSSRLYATLTDVGGNPIVGAKVNLVLGTIDKTVKTDSKGRISASTKSLAPGKYTAKISYGGNDAYSKSSTTAKVTVNKIPTTLTAKDIVADQGANTRFYVTLKDADGNLLTGVKVRLVLGDIDKTVKTDASGRISASLKNLAAGSYTAAISCAGTEIYGASSTTASVIIC